MNAVNLSRRSLLAGLGLSLTGLAVGIVPATADELQGPTKPGLDAASPKEEARLPGLNPNVFVHVGADDVVTIVCARSEMGQGVRSSVPVLVADELGADMRRVVVVQAVGDAKYGDQNTDGSSSIRGFYDDLRRVGAVARTMLVTAAARQWKVDPATCVARDGVVTHAPSGRRATFGELVPTAAKLKVPDPAKVTLRPETELSEVRGAGFPLLDGPGLVDGTAVFGADVRLPDMLVAVIARPPVVGGKVGKLDTARALQVPGVRAVLQLPDPTPPWRFQQWGGVAVLAEDTWAAIKGRAALDVTWEAGDNGGYDSRQYRETLLAATREPGVPIRNHGDAEAALKSASRVIEAEYYVPHLAQLPMEPLAAVARVADGRCEVWAPTQHPQEARANAAEAAGLSEDAVTVNVTLLGGGFGRKSKADFVREAVWLAKEAKAPVRVQWTREDDVRHGYYNTVNAQRLQAGLDADGRVVAWHQRTAFPPIASTYAFAPPPATDPERPTALDLQQGVLDWPFAVPNVRAEACAAKAHARIGWYRSVYNIFHAFAMGSFIDEIAHARGADPREVWLDVIGPARTMDLAALGVESLANYGASLEQHPVDAGRLRAVLERVTASAKWSERGDRALGLAAHRSFLSYAAAVVSVVRDRRGKVRVDEVWIALDAGRVVNRDRVHAQLEGAVVMGISNALFGGITMREGATEQSNFGDARVARIGDVPRRIHVDLVPSDLAPCGVGEPGVPPIGPAIANAIFALTGERVRSFPLAAGLSG